VPPRRHRRGGVLAQRLAVATRPCVSSGL
jgi:hypothetical protein